VEPVTVGALAVALGHDFGLQQRMKNSKARSSSRSLPLNASTKAFRQDDPGSMNTDPLALNRHQSAIAGDGSLHFKGEGFHGDSYVTVRTLSTQATAVWSKAKPATDTTPHNQPNRTS